MLHLRLDTYVHVRVRGVALYTCVCVYILALVYHVWVWWLIGVRGNTFVQHVTHIPKYGILWFLGQKPNCTLEHLLERRTTKAVVCLKCLYI